MKLRTYRRLFLALCVVFVLVSQYPCYTGDILRSDDFSRVADNANLDADFFRALLIDNRSDGFYRPLNHLSFGLTYYLFGFQPLPYALFNLLVLLGCAWALFGVLSALSRSATFASIATFGWLLNIEPIHAVSMACLFLALLAKENAIVGPVLVLLLAGVELGHEGGLRRRHLLGAAAAAALPYGGYFALRTASHAMTPATAPACYRLDFSPVVLARNITGCLSRSLLYSALLVPALFLRPRAALLAGSGRWPRRRSELKGLLVMMTAVGLLVAPIAWARGTTVARGSTVYRWSRVIAEQVGQSGFPSVVLRYDPVAVRLNQEDLDRPGEPPGIRFLVAPGEPRTESAPGGTAPE